MTLLRIAFAVLALVIGLRRLGNWRRTGHREELLRASIMGAVLVLAVTNHRAALVPLVALLAVFAWRRLSPARGARPSTAAPQIELLPEAPPAPSVQDAHDSEDAEPDAGEALADDWSAQERELRRTFPDYERNLEASPNVVDARSHDARFQLARAARWNASPDGALELAAGWHEARASLAFEYSPPVDDGLEVVRLRLKIDAGGSAYDLDALLDGWSLLDLALASETPSAYLLRCPAAWRRALATELRITNARALNDSREHVDFAIEGATVHIRLKYQGFRFDLAFLPPSPDVGTGKLGADETRLLVVLRGVTAELADEVETMPPLVCALRIETLLERIDSVAIDGREIPSPRITRPAPG